MDRLRFRFFAAALVAVFFDSNVDPSPVGQIYSSERGRSTDEQICAATSHMHENLPSSSQIEDKCMRYAILLSIADSNYVIHDTTIIDIMTMEKDSLISHYEEMNRKEVSSIFMKTLDRYRTVGLDPAFLDLVECLRLTHTSYAAAYLDDKEMILIEDLLKQALDSSNQLIDINPAPGEYHPPFLSNLRYIFRSYPRVTKKLSESGLHDIVEPTTHSIAGADSSSVPPQQQDRDKQLPRERYLEYKSERARLHNRRKRILDPDLMRSLSRIKQRRLRARWKKKQNQTSNAEHHEGVEQRTPTHQDQRQSRHQRRKQVNREQRQTKRKRRVVTKEHSDPLFEKFVHLQGSQFQTEREHQTEGQVLPSQQQFAPAPPDLLAQPDRVMPSPQRPDTQVPVQTSIDPTTNYSMYLSPIESQYHFHRALSSPFHAEIPGLSETPEKGQMMSDPILLPNIIETGATNLGPAGIDITDDGATRPEQDQVDNLDLVLPSFEADSLEERQAHQDLIDGATRNNETEKHTQSILDQLPTKIPDDPGAAT